MERMRSNPDNPYSARPIFNIMEDVMNQDQTKGKFQQLKGKLKETWGRLSDDELALYEGQRDQFFGKLQEKYGLMREEAEERIRSMERAQKGRLRHTTPIAFITKNGGHVVTAIPRSENAVFPGEDGVFRFYWPEFLAMVTDCV